MFAQAQKIPNLPVVHEQMEGKGWMESSDSNLVVAYMKEMVRLTGRELKGFPNSAPEKVWVLLPLIEQFQIKHPELPDWASDPKPTYSGVAAKWADGTVGWAAFLAKEVNIPTKDGDKEYQFQFRYGKHDPGANKFLWKRDPGFNGNAGMMYDRESTTDEVWEASMKAIAFGTPIGDVMTVLAEVQWKHDLSKKKTEDGKKK
jgi:antitoxin component HigA of HigAB toxin-antitoxin module